MASIFSKIVNGEIPCHKIAETEDYFAFLDIRPLKRGHTLVIPKKEVDYIFDLSPEALAGLHQFAQRVAKAVEKAIPCIRIGVAVIGLEVPHAHIHLIPLEIMSDMDFRKKPLTLTPEEMAQTAEEIRQYFI